MAESFFGKLRRGLGALTDKAASLSGGDDAVFTRALAKHCEALATARAGLDSETAEFVAKGERTSILSTLASADIRTVWRKHYRTYAPDDHAKLFEPEMAWDAVRLGRFGQVLAALQPISHDWGFFGTKTSPDALRHAMTLRLGRQRQAPIELLAALTAQAGESLVPALDILLSRPANNYSVHNSVDRFTGVAEWLDGCAEAATAALPGLDADQRAEFAAAIGRLGLTGRYLDTLVALAIGPSKKARTAARQALTGADPAALTAHLQALYPGLAPNARAETVELAAVALGKGAKDLLAQWKTGETAARALAAIERVGGALDAGSPAAGGAEARPDGPEGYLAIDGVYVEAPPRPPLPEPSPIPAATLARLEPSLAAFNEKLAAAKREAAEQLQHYHWSRNLDPVGRAEFYAFQIQGEGDGAIDLRQHRGLGWVKSAVGELPGVAAFFNDPELPLRSLVRYAVLASNGHFTSVFNDWSGPAGRALARRLEEGVDLRVVLALWTRFGGLDPVAQQLRSTYRSIALPEDLALWPAYCGHFALFDEAFGLTPQSGPTPMQVRFALEALDRFPKPPRRYQPALMLLATGAIANLRKAARQALREAPGIDEAIVALLGDGRQEVRAGAAEWLQQRGARAKLPELRAALAKERSEVARAALITARERLGDDVGDVFDADKMIAEAEKGLAKTRVKELDWFPFAQMPALRWRDGSAVDPRLPRWWATLAAKLKQPGGNALIDLWLDRLAPGDAHKLGWMVLTSWIEQDTRTCSADEANAFAAANVDATIQQHQRMIQNWPQSASYWSVDRDTVFAQLKNGKLNTYLGSAADSKGVLALATRVNGADAAGKVRPFLKNHGARASQAKALLETLARNPSSAALQVVLAAANRSKQRSVQAHAGELIAEVAERHGWNAEQLADRTIPTGGLDADGALELDCGRDRAYALRLDAEDALVLVNAEGKEVKSLPAPRIDDEKPLIDAAKKLLSNARKEVKQVFAQQTERLREAMALGRRWPREDWQSFIAGHPLVGRLAQRLIWLGGDAEASALTAFRPLGDGTYTDAADAEVDVTGFAEVRLAHSSLLAPDAIAAWKKHFADYEIKPPFDQIGRDLPTLPADQMNERLIRDRAGWTIETFQLRGVATKLGYVRGSAEDGGWFTLYDKPYRSAGIVAEIEFSGSPLPEQNAPAALVSLGFRVLRESGERGRQLALKDIPPVLLAETWQDWRDIAAKGGGFDAEWRKKVS